MTATISVSGYLTVKGYERTYNRFLLDFPNNEVKNGFVSLIAEATES